MTKWYGFSQLWPITEGRPLFFHVCVLRAKNKRVWWIFKRHTHSANYTPTYFNLVPAFIRVFDKLGNHNKEITLRPWSSQCSERGGDGAAHLVSHHLSLLSTFMSLVTFAYGSLTWKTHLFASRPSEFADARVILASTLSVCLSVSPSVCLWSLHGLD